MHPAKERSTQEALNIPSATLKLLRTFGALKFFGVLHIPMNAQLTHETTVERILGE